MTTKKEHPFPFLYEKVTGEKAQLIDEDRYKKEMEELDFWFGLFKKR